METSQAHESSAGTEGFAPPDGTQYEDNGLKPLDQLRIAISESIKRPGLLSEQTEH